MSKPKRLLKPLRDLHDVKITLECYDLTWLDDMKLRDLVQANGLALDALATLAAICGHIHDLKKAAGMDTDVGLRALGLRRDAH